MKLHYYKNQLNFGDVASPLIVEHIARKKVKFAPYRSAQLLAAGSVLYYGQNILKEISRVNDGVWQTTNKLVSAWLKKYFRPTLHIWGSGFIKYPQFKTPIHTRRLQVHALRGRISAEILRQYEFKLGDNVAYGDPGLLFSELIETKDIEKKYEIGLVPHLSDTAAGARAAQLLESKGLKIKLVNLADEPLKVIREIAACETVLSSSLHGLITADSLHIANRHLVFSTFGYSYDDFILKFNDYYSAFACKDAPLGFDELFGALGDIPQKIKATTLLQWEAVDAQKKCLMEAFPNL